MKLRILYHFLKYRRLSGIRTKKQLESIQERGLRSLERHLKTKSAYFSEQLRLVDGVRNLPVMSKAKMMEHFDRMVCVPVGREEALAVAIGSEHCRDFGLQIRNVTVGLSSGTSGHRGLFLANCRERDQWTGAILARMLPEVRLGMKVAFFLRANSTLYETANHAGIKFLYFDIYITMDAHVNKLNSFQPELLIAPPSVLLELGRYVEKGKLNIVPEKVISVAEVLEVQDRERLACLFKQKVIHQVYQCTEGFLGYTCRYGTLHLNEDIVLVEREMLDAKRFIPIITDFTRRSQPIVRYRLNDVLVLRETPCPCGSVHTALERVEGREDDVLRFKNDLARDVVVYSDMICRLMVYVDGIRQYEVIQYQDHLDIRIEPELGADISRIQRDIELEFKKLFQKLEIPLPKLEYHAYVCDLNTKMKRVRRCVD